MAEREEVLREWLEDELQKRMELLREYGEFTPSGVFEAGRVDGLRIVLEQVDKLAE